VAKKKSGAWRKRYAAITQAMKSSPHFSSLLPKRGRPRLVTDQLRAQLCKDLVWIGEPDLSNSALTKMLQTRKAYKKAYKHISERSLRREVAAVQRKIWPYR
jgi:hypothetical protein